MDLLDVGVLGPKIWLFRMKPEVSYGWQAQRASIDAGWMGVGTGG